MENNIADINDLVVFLSRYSRTINNKNRALSKISKKYF